MSRDPALVAVIGPVETALLDAWLSHYRAYGIDRFLLALHIPDDSDTEQRDRLLVTCREHGITPALTVGGLWHEHVNTRLRDALREQAGDGWHVLADADEFHAYPGRLQDILERAGRTGAVTIGGLLLDRVARDGRLAGWDQAAGLDGAYPLGGLITHRLLRGDPRKIVAVRAGVPVASGNHRSPSRPPASLPPVPVHHFKWRAVRRYLDQREARYRDGTWQTASPALLSEARRLLDYLDGHGGRFDVWDPLLGLRPVTLGEQPSWWEGEATAVVAAWRPPGHGSQDELPGSMTSSPSP
jgi:Glycosyl transferase family 2